jgi:hypothetical protein
VKTEKPLLTKIDIEHVWAKKHKHWNYVIFWVSQNSIFFAQMGGNIVEEGAKSIFGPTCTTCCQIWGGSIMI